MKHKALAKFEDSLSEVIQNTIKTLPKNEKKLLLIWSQNALQIQQNKELSKSEKITALRKLNTPEILKIVIPKIITIVKNKTWINQSWARRFGVIGFSVGSIVFGGTGVGIATLGAGMGLPLVMLTAGGAVILGSMIDEIKKELK